MATNLQFIKSASGSSVTALDLTDCFSADYDVYYLTWSLNISGTAGYAQAYLLDSGGSPLTGFDYDYAGLEMFANSAFVEAKTTSSQFWRGIGAYQDDGKGYGFSAYIYNPFDSSSYTFVTSQSGSMITANTVLMGEKYIGVYKQASSVYGIRLTNSTPTSYEYINAKIFGVK